RQIQADVFGQHVVTVNSEEGPALGVALLAAVGAGAFKNIQEACKAVIKVVKKTKPNLKTKKVYDKSMPVYQNLYLSLKEDFKKL
ncbi:MAG: xylulokinase, partial [Planctomycetaceae bacterium]|nr:xylulokinase [Planctomycetaceae bacterium]